MIVNNNCSKSVFYKESFVLCDEVNQILRLVFT